MFSFLQKGYLVLSRLQLWQLHLLQPVSKSVIDFLGYITIEKGGCFGYVLS